MTDGTRLPPAAAAGGATGVTGSVAAAAAAAGCPHFPFPDRPGVGLDPEYLQRFRDQPLLPVRLAGGHDALVVTGYSDVRTVLADPRFSREAWANGTLFARKRGSLALATSDAPTHTRRRSTVQGWFTHRRAEEDRARIARVADELLDQLLERTQGTGQPVDLIAEFTTPFPYRIICDMLDVPVGDLDRLLPRVTVMMSSGRFPAEEVSAAHEFMYGYFFDQLALRRKAAEAGTPGTDLLTSLLTAPEETRLSDEEIVVFGFGLLMAGGETTASHLAMCVLQVLRTPGLADSLRRDPSAIPAVVEELLRWAWFAGTGGQPHVTLEEVELGGRTIGAGQVVIPVTDAANRDREVFPDADEFRPDRTPNPHLGLGHGRHMCLGAAHARVELQEGLSAVLRRLDGLEVAAGVGELDWRSQMFMRGVWQLPVRWRAPQDAT